MTISSSNSHASSNVDTSTSSALETAVVGFDNLPNSRLVFDQPTIRKAIDRLAVQLNVELRGANPVFLAVLHGGLPFAGELLMRFQGGCDLGYVHVGRYGSDTSGGALRWHVEPTVELTDRIVVFLDDVLDKGETLAALRARAGELGAREVRAAVLVRKVVADCVSQAEYVALEAPDLFLFGYGMDIDGQWRNLPEIRACLPGTAEVGK